MENFKGDIALPGKWSPRLFFSDLAQFPIQNMDLAEKSIKDSISYLDFFELTRGFPSPYSGDEYRKDIFSIFEKGSIMLYFEDTFLRLIQVQEMSSEVEIIIQYMRALSEAKINEWNEIVRKIGACCFQFFSKEPELYVSLLSRREELSDDELLEKFGSELSPVPYTGRISVEDSRSILIREVAKKSKGS